MDQEPEINFDEEAGAASWAALDSFLGRLTAPVRLVVWGEEGAGSLDSEAANLCRTLAGRYGFLESDYRPRVGFNPYHPIIGLMGVDEQGMEVDYQLRIIGLPAGYQINTLVGAIQAVSFKGQTLEAVTRIQLARLADEVTLELFTTPEDEAGVHMATLLANLAVVNDQIRTSIIMANNFPDLIPRYSIYNVPHTIINGRHHLEGVIDEEKILKMIAREVKRNRPAARE